MTRLPAEPNAHASGSDDDKTEQQQPLTRRELRERERRAEALREAASQAPAGSEAAPAAAESLAAAAEPSPIVVPAAVTPAVSPQPAEALTLPAPAPVSQDAPAELTTSTAVLPVLSAGVTTHSAEIVLPVAAAPAVSERRADRRAAEAQASARPTRASARTAPSARRANRTSHATSEAQRPKAPEWTPTRVIESAPSSVRRTTGRVGILAARGASVAAMAIVALLAVSTSLPAEALLSSADVVSAQAANATKTAETQRVDIASGVGAIAVERDGYESKSVAEFAAASGIRLEATFTNNPNGTVQWPFAVGVHVGDRFGFRDCAGCSSNHGGQDFNPGVGAPIQSIADGVVTVAEDGEGSLGVHMMIEHVINGETVTSVYAHMIHGSMEFQTGDVVKVGQVIGKTGTTGMSTGPHLHFEIRLGGVSGTKVDPLTWLEENTN